MPRFRLLLFLSFAFFQSAYAKCTVIDQETKEPAHCVFPFRDKYDNFNTNCTNFKDPEERYWCSTKVSTYVCNFPLLTTFSSCLSGVANITSSW